MNKFCTLLTFFLLLIPALAVAQTPAPHQVEQLLDEMEISNREIRHLVSSAENRLRRLDVWAGESHSPQKSMRVGTLETELGKQFVWMGVCGSEVATLTQTLSDLDPRISIDFFVPMKTKTSVVSKTLETRLTAMVSAVNSEDREKTAILRAKMEKQLLALAQQTRTLDLQINRLRRNLLHS